MIPPTKLAALWILIFLSIINCTKSAKSSEGRVVCYYTNWSVYRPGTAKFNPQNINPYLCTHLIYAFGGFTKDNALKPFDKYQDVEQGGYAKFNGLKTYNKQLKTLLAIGGWNEGSGRFSSLVASPKRRQKFTKNIIKFLRQNHFDGLDLDWEYPAHREGGKPRDKDNYAQFVQELREEFERESSKTGRPRLLLTMAVPAGTEYIKKGYDIPKLNKYLDWFNLLSYDYHSAFEPSVNHHSPLYPLEEDSEYNYDSELNIDYSVKFYLNEGADRDKIVLGIPTYGRTYTLLNEDATDIGAPSDGPGAQGDATREKGYLAYYEICQGIKEDEDWTVIQPNPKAMGPYAYRENQWVGYDDESIAARKGEYVMANGLGGIMFWSIDNDDFRGSCHGRPYPIIEAAKEGMNNYLGDSDNEISLPRKKSNRSRSRQGLSSTDLSDDEKKSSKSKSTDTKRISNRRRPSISSTTEVAYKVPASRTTTPPPPTTPDPGADFKCEDEGFFSHPRDCKKYFWCLDSGPSNLGIVGHQFTCPSGLVFNKITDSCDYTRNVVCSKPSEPEPITSTTKEPTTRKSIKKVDKLRTTTATPIDDEEYEDEEEYDDEVSSKFKETLEEEDPKVIKELINLIKKAGGITELEKQLRLQDDSGKHSETTATTQSTISKKLYQKVLSRRPGSNNRVPPTLTVKSETVPNKDNKYSSVIRNSRPRPQNDGIDTELIRERPKYVTINRSKPQTTESSVEYEDDEDVEGNDEPKVELIERKDEQPINRGSYQSNYVNIRRQRPSSIVQQTDNEEDEDDEDDVINTGPVRTTPKNKYLNLVRSRPTTTTTAKTTESITTTETAKEISATTRFKFLERTRPTRTTTTESPTTIGDNQSPDDDKEPTMVSELDQLNTDSPSDTTSRPYSNLLRRTTTIPSIQTPSTTPQTLTTQYVEPLQTSSPFVVELIQTTITNRNEQSDDMVGETTTVQLTDINDADQQQIEVTEENLLIPKTQSAPTSQLDLDVNILDKRVSSSTESNDIVTIEPIQSSTRTFDSKATVNRLKPFNDRNFLGIVSSPRPFGFISRNRSSITTTTTNTPTTIISIPTKVSFDHRSQIFTDSLVNETLFNDDQLNQIDGSDAGNDGIASGRDNFLSTRTQNRFNIARNSGTIDTTTTTTTNAPNRRINGFRRRYSPVRNLLIDETIENSSTTEQYFDRKRYRSSGTADNLIVRKRLISRLAVDSSSPTVQSSETVADGDSSTTTEQSSFRQRYLNRGRSRFSTRTTEQPDDTVLDQSETFSQRTLLTRTYRPHFDLSTATTEALVRPLRPRIESDLSSLTSFDFNRYNPDETDRPLPRRVWTSQRGRRTRTSTTTTTTAPPTDDSLSESSNEHRTTVLVTRSTGSPTNGYRNRFNFNRLRTTTETLPIKDVAAEEINDSEAENSLRIDSGQKYTGDKFVSEQPTAPRRFALETSVYNNPSDNQLAGERKLKRKLKFNDSPIIYLVASKSPKQINLNNEILPPSPEILSKEIITDGDDVQITTDHLQHSSSEQVDHEITTIGSSDDETEEGDGVTDNFNPISLPLRTRRPLQRYTTERNQSLDEVTSTTSHPESVVTSATTTTGNRRLLRTRRPFQNTQESSEQPEDVSQPTVETTHSPRRRLRVNKIRRPITNQTTTEPTNSVTLSRRRRPLVRQSTESTTIESSSPHQGDSTTESVRRNLLSRRRKLYRTSTVPPVDDTDFNDPTIVESISSQRISANLRRTEVTNQTDDGLIREYSYQDSEQSLREKDIFKRPVNRNRFLSRNRNLSNKDSETPIQSTHELSETYQETLYEKSDKFNPADNDNETAILREPETFDFESYTQSNIEDATEYEVPDISQYLLKDEDDITTNRIEQPSTTVPPVHRRRKIIRKLRPTSTTTELTTLSTKLKIDDRSTESAVPIRRRIKKLRRKLIPSEATTESVSYRQPKTQYDRNQNEDQSESKEDDRDISTTSEQTKETEILTSRVAQNRRPYRPIRPSLTQITTSTEKSTTAKVFVRKFSNKFVNPVIPGAVDAEPIVDDDETILGNVKPFRRPNYNRFKPSFLRNQSEEEEEEKSAEEEVVDEEEDKEIEVEELFTLPPDQFITRSTSRFIPSRPAYDPTRSYKFTRPPTASSDDDINESSDDESKESDQPINNRPKYLRNKYTTPIHPASLARSRTTAIPLTAITRKFGTQATEPAALVRTQEPDVNVLAARNKKLFNKKYTVTKVTTTTQPPQTDLDQLDNETTETTQIHDQTDDQNTLNTNTMMEYDDEQMTSTFVTDLMDDVFINTITNFENELQEPETTVRSFKPFTRKPLQQTTTMKPTTLHHIFAIDVNDDEQKTEMSIDSGEDRNEISNNSGEVISSRVEKLAEVSRIVEIYSQQAKHLKGDGDKTETSNLVLEKLPTVSKLGEISRYTLIKMVDKHGNRTVTVKKSRDLLLPESIFSVETSTIPLQGLFETDREGKRFNIVYATTNGVAATTESIVVTNGTSNKSIMETSKIDSTTEPMGTTKNQQHYVRPLAPLLRPESNESSPLVISIANLDQVILSKVPTTTKTTTTATTELPTSPSETVTNKLVDVTKVSDSSTETIVDDELVPTAPIIFDEQLALVNAQSVNTRVSRKISPNSNSSGSSGGRTDEFGQRSTNGNRKLDAHEVRSQFRPNYRRPTNTTRPFARTTKTTPSANDSINPTEPSKLPSRSTIRRTRRPSIVPTKTTPRSTTISTETTSLRQLTRRKFVRPTGDKRRIITTTASPPVSTMKTVTNNYEYADSTQSTDRSRTQHPTFRRRFGYVSSTSRRPTTTAQSSRYLFLTTPLPRTTTTTTTTTETNNVEDDEKIDQHLEPSIQDSKFLNNRYNQIGETINDELAEAITVISRAPLPVQSRTVDVPPIEPHRYQVYEETEDDIPEVVVAITRRMGTSTPTIKKTSTTHRPQLSTQRISNTTPKQELFLRKRPRTQRFQQTLPQTINQSLGDHHQNYDYSDDPLGDQNQKTIDYNDYYDDEQIPIIGKQNSKVKVILHDAGIIECLDQGNFPHPLSCRKFISCAKMETGGVVGWAYTCPKGLSYDPVGGICNWAAGLGCKESRK